MVLLRSFRLIGHTTHPSGSNIFKDCGVLFNFFKQLGRNIIRLFFVSFRALAVVLDLVEIKETKDPQ